MVDQRYKQDENLQKLLDGIIGVEEAEKIFGVLEEIKKIRR
mgnify:FL=1